MVKHTFFAITLGLLLFALYLFQYTGAFKSVTVGIDRRGPFTIIYKEHSGAYHKIVPVIQEVESWAKNNNLKCRLSFGEYFDNPDLVEEGRLKSRGGCLVDPLVQEELKILKNLNLPTDYKTAVIGEGQFVVALFSGAASIGPVKVYPKAHEFMRKGNLKPVGSVIEIYEIFDQQSMATTYLWPVSSISSID